MNRRRFLATTAAASISSLLVRRAAATDSPNERINLGMIGLGIHGMGWNLDAFLKIPGARVVAACDVFKERRDAAKAKIDTAYGNTDCTTHVDFREVLARGDVDAVVISTPDHWHVLMSVMAARAGKDVFCEKPTLNVSQGQVLMEVMKQTGVVYAGGIEDRSVEQYHRMAELARNGFLGKVNRILVSLPPGEVYEKEEEAPVPDGLEYDLWLGPAPYTPYTPTKLGAQQWRNHWHYSGGKLTDWGAHLMDTAQIAIFQEHGGPVEINGEGEFPENAMSTTATRYEILYRYPDDVEMLVKSGGTGIRIEGSEGWVQCPQWRSPLEASDPSLLEAVIPAEGNRMWPRPLSEHEDFIEAVRNRSKTTYTPRDIHHLSNAMHLGNISMRLGRKLKWDPTQEGFPDDPEADDLLSCPMRAPWSFDTAS